MANTRLTKTIRDEIAKAINELTQAPVKFIELPRALASRWQRKAAWEFLLPEDLLQGSAMVADWGYSSACLTTAQITGFLDGKPIVLNLGNEPNPPDLVGCTLNSHMYLMATSQVRTRHWGGALKADFEAMFGPDWNEVRDWMRLTRDDSRSAEEANKTLVDDILGMVVTAGQLKRMVPDLLKYLPDDKRDMLNQQVRASSLPYEWAAYDRERVERAITYIAKCHMLRGIGNVFRQSFERNENITWCNPLKS